MNFPRRLLIYIVLIVTLNIFSFGMVGLISWIFDLSGLIGNANPQNIAPFLAAIIVCFPIWLFTWRYSTKIVVNSPEEGKSTIRNLYLNWVLIIATVYLSIFLFNIIDSLVNTDFSISGTTISFFLVWAPIFYIHYKFAQGNWLESNSRKRIHELYLNIVFLVSGILIFIALRNLIFSSIDYLLMLSASNDVLVGKLDFDFNPGDFSILITGLALWLYSWNFRIKKVNYDFKIIDVGIITISQSLIFLVSIFIILAQAVLLIFGIGNNSSGSLYTTLAFFPEVFSFTVASFLIWLYFAPAFLNNGMKKLYEIDSHALKWVYRYSIKALAIIFIIASSFSTLVFLIGIPLNFLNTTLLPDDNGFESTLLSSALSALIIGYSLLRYVNYRISNDDQDQSKSKVDKSYIYFVAILFAFLLIGSLITMLTILIRDILGLSIGWATLELIRWPFSIAFNSLIILAFYRNTIKEKFKTGSLVDAPKKSLTIFSGSKIEVLKDDFNRLYRVKNWTSVKELGKFKTSKRGLDELAKTVKKISNDNNLFIIEGSNGDISLYDYNN